jgi:hypothetical protein
MYEDDEYEEYEDNPPQRNRTRRRKLFFLQWKLVVAAVLVLALASLRFCGGGRPRPLEGAERTEVMTVTDWRAVDAALRGGMEHAYGKAENYARAEVRAWVQELQVRVDEDFLPVWFSYVFQQSVSLKAAGYWCMDTPLIEGVIGKQGSVEERLEQLVAREFQARVLQPKSAQLRIDKITKRTVAIYAQELQDELVKVQVEYGIPEQDFGRYLGGIAPTVLTLDANRQVPLLMKGVSLGSGVAALKLGQSVVTRVEALSMRHFGRELLEGGARLGGRYVARSAGWWVAGICMVWDLADHYKTRSTNLPVMRRSLNVFLQELEEQVLTDARCGVLTTLDRVEQELIRRIETQP